MMRKLRTVRMLASVLLAVGCEGSDASGPAKMSLDAINGRWAFDFRAATACSFSLQGNLYAQLAFTGDNSTDVANTVSKWSNDSLVPDRYNLIGNLNRSTGRIELRFWQSVLQRGTLLEGTISPAGTFTGNGTDPIPGYQGYLSLNGCAYTVTGRKRA